MLRPSSLAVAPLELRIARALPSYRLRAPIAPAPIARQSHLQAIQAARRRIHLLRRRHAVVTQDDPAPSRRIAAHPELPVAQVLHTAIFAGIAGGAGTDGAR